eukprot:CAMPEP_0170514928 /NCGR_PEP_ID=MMETSP0209-20121228/1432_1 /TAXON_ID=665100 ORGANISM="Litonotus pictus, Strain P1" /NCGR_SAMPLE_ID=MMETSP0209 /ASSEMBLY_ACC=CAM_ASM_000301 /LENGTH=391 /DNA_ID=CAMNT_0010799199 /DNA_START=425 /DNA_END=1600 /DNA_ORIENTATION=-
MRTSLEPLIGQMLEVTKLLLEKEVNDSKGENILWANTIETIDLASRVTFDTFHRVMYNWDPKACSFSEESSELIESCNTVAGSIGKRNHHPFPFMFKLPTKENKKLKRSLQYIKAFSSKFINEQKEKLNEELRIQEGITLEEQEQKDATKKSRCLLEEMILANSLITNEDSDPSNIKEGMTNEELLDNISGLFFGAYDTTSNTINFILYYLAIYPECQEKLRSSILSTFPLKEQDLLKSTVDKIEGIRFLSYFIDEVNRLCPLFAMFGRDCLKDIVVNGYQFNSGDVVGIDSKTIGCDPKNWNGMTDTDQFRPERWGEYRPHMLEGMMPFGFGGRICPGRKIAMVEMKTFVIVVLLNYKVELRNPEKEALFDNNLGKNFKKGYGNINFSRT